MKQSPGQKIVRIVGVLFILQMATAVISHSVILEPILYNSDFLARLTGKPELVTLAMLSDLVCGASVFAIAVLLFPILKQYSERVALWYVGQRLSELVCLMISGVLLMTMLNIGQQTGNVPAADEAGLESVGIALRSARSNIQIIYLLIYCLGAWSFYGLLFHARLVPRFISVWGLLGVTLLFVEILSNAFGASVGGILIMMPLGLNELFLGVWFIVKGIRSNAGT